MNIMVFDVPASSRGALSILEDFHSEVMSKKIKDINWVFVVSEPELAEKENLKVLRYPWIKKSWFHRLYFDYFVASKLVKQYKIDKIMSFQNMVIPGTTIPQVLYVHQSLPFVDYKFSFSENKKYWIYQNIIGRKIKSSIVKAEKVAVQMDWLKDVFIEQTGVSGSKIKVIPPKIKREIQGEFHPSQENLRRFFFPAGPMDYKNHRIIVDACMKLKEEGISDYEVIFTLTGTENDNVRNLYKKVEEESLPVSFIGNISRDKVFELYKKSVLVFPSYIETFGLPMLESRLCKGLVLASDCAFSNEVLENYSNAYFFDPFQANELAGLLEGVISGGIGYRRIDEDRASKEGKGWDLLFDLLAE